MTDTIATRLAKLQAKIKIPNKLEKAEFQARIERTKKHRCAHCNKRLFDESKTYIRDKKLICGKCNEYI